MKKYILLIISCIGLANIGCKKSDSESQNSILQHSSKDSIVVKKKLTDFVPKGYVVVEKIEGDLNKDGISDCVILVKGTDKKNFIKDDTRGILDRNRRGIIILFNGQNGYELAVKNLTCFSSENEDGGVYYAPELSLEIKKGILYIHYLHGRYGYWVYTFRYQHSDFELIGYENNENNGPVANRVISINFSTKNKIVERNINADAEDGEEVFEKTESKIKIDKLIKLSEIKNFDELDHSDMFSGW